MIELGIFILLSILLLAFTLSRPHRHRFPRFFAFESLFALVLLNVRSWFRDPLSLSQLISWIFLASSIVLAIHSFRLLRIAGSPEEDIENTTQLVTMGVYRYIRHPLYCTLLLGGVGAFLKAPSVLGFLLFTFVFIFVFVTAKVEEVGNIERFGDEYLAYMKTTRMFLPFLI
ncbi:MAG: isoprenylcysteine carboxylmethyltransferase family protein [Candidatus Aminicenantaceae bacterium]